MNEAVINKPVGKDWVVSKAKNRVRVIKNHSTPIKFDIDAVFSFMPGEMLSPADSKPYLKAPAPAGNTWRSGHNE